MPNPLSVALLLATSPLWAAIATAAPPNAPAALDIDKIAAIGEAHAPDGGPLLYREYHSYSPDGIHHHVLYRDSTDQPLTEKTISYATGPATPTFTQQNVQTGRRLQVLWNKPPKNASRPALQNEPAQNATPDKNNRASTANTGNKTTKPSPIKAGTAQTNPKSPATLRVLDSRRKTAKTLTPSGQFPLVIDAGFDPFIRAHLPHLLAGEQLTFEFLFAKRARLIRLKAQAQPCKDTPQNHCILIKPHSRLIRLIAPPLRLEYDQTPRLIRYRGPSNLSDHQGKGKQVEIHYQY
ncbi:MAG: hypothetical protein GDA55_03345 [Cellvibrionales bacterium]|nr:hypothetical protein [Cellvibrionales bacterium]